LEAVFDRLDLIGELSEHNELAWDDTAGCFSPPQRIGKAQRDPGAGAVAWSLIPRKFWSSRLPWPVSPATRSQRSFEYEPSCVGPKNEETSTVFP
jgi:hypothetical protein